MKVARTVLRGGEDIRRNRNSSSYSTDMERGDLLEMAKKESKEIEKALDNYEVLTGDAAVKRLAEIRFMEEIDKKSFYAKAESEGMAKRRG